MLQSITEFSSYSITEFNTYIHQMLRNTEAETTECYEMIFKLIQSPTFHNVLIHFIIRFPHFTTFH